MAKAEKHTVCWTEHRRPDKVKKITRGNLKDAETLRRQKSIDPTVVEAWIESDTPKFPRR
jgi:hypothetical protein